METDIISLQILRDYIKSDYEANERKKRSCGYKYLKWLRICRYFYLKNFKILGGISRIIKNIYGNKFGFDFKYNVCLGNGYTISHNTGVIFMAEGAGDNLIFRNFVVVGESVPGGGSPTIGNNVMFGTGCKVLGHIKVGSNVVIGANAVVTHDIPDNSVVVGIPAKVIRKTKDRWGTPFEKEEKMEVRL